MSTIVCSLQGRFGNQCMQYLFARGLAERFRKELRTDPWVGERVFKISHPRPNITEEHGGRYIDGHHLLRLSEADLKQCWDWNDPPQTVPGGPIEFRGYAQTQWCVDFYTKRQAQAWLNLRPEIEHACNRAVNDSPSASTATVVAHRRAGDYFGYSYPVCAEDSYRYAAQQFGLKWQSPDAILLCEECPIDHVGFLPDDLSFMPDFYRMMTAPTLLRGNSSFSWVAALLGNGLVLSPVVDGLEGGKEHHCRFVAGNHPKFCNLDFVTDLHVSP